MTELSGDKDRIAVLWKEWEGIQWASDQGAITNATDAKKANDRQIAIEREIDRLEGPGVIDPNCPTDPEDQPRL